MRIVLALLIGASTAGSAASAFAASSPAPPPKFVVDQARRLVAHAHSTQPIEAWFVRTRRQDANDVLSGAGVNSDQRVYVIAIKGAFTVVRPGPTATGSMRVSVLDSVIDARTGRETDGGFGRTLPDLPRLGAVRTLLPYQVTKLVDFGVIIEDVRGVGGDAGWCLDLVSRETRDGERTQA